MSSDANKSEVKVFKFGEESLSDVIFIVGGEEFHSHRMALAARSPYFASMFTSSFKEKNEEHIEIEADPMAFKRLMEILYNGIFDGHEVFFHRDGNQANPVMQSLWSESCALLELADRFLVFDIVCKVFEAFMIVTNKCCEGKDCYLCATKLLLSLRFQMKNYCSGICKVPSARISNTFECLKPVQKDLTLSMDAMKFLMNRSKLSS